MIRKDFKGILSYFERDNGKEDTIILLHGFQDTARGFYFLEDYLSHRFNILSPDWRGHGDSPGAPEGWYYSFPALLADLAQFTGSLVPKGYHLLGHSLGAALGARFTGLVPQEVKSLTLLEGFSGRWPPEKEADRMQDWIKKLRRNKPTRESSMPSLGAVEELLAKAHPNTPPENRKKLAELWTNAKDNRYSWKHDPALRSRMLPVPFPPDLSRELWRRIQCPVLFVYGLRSELRPPDDQKSEILSHFGNLQEVALDSGHNPHQEIPEQLIQTLDKFYTEMPRMDQSVNQ